MMHKTRIPRADKVQRKGTSCQDMGSIIKKRRKKIRKHKLKKLRKKMRHRK